MRPYKIVSDSSGDLFEDLTAQYDIDIVPFYLSFDGASHIKDGVDISHKEVYARMRQKNVFPKTSLPSISDYADRFRKHLADGFDVLCLCITSKLSGSYQSAVNAAALMTEEFPGQKVKVIDSYNVTLLQGMILHDMAIMKESGLSMEEVTDTLSTYMYDYGIFLTVDTLEYLEKGGRVGKAAALAGSLLGIKPIISFSGGELQPHSKVRGRKKALNEIIELTDNTLRNKKDKYRILCLNADCESEAYEVMEQMKSRGYEFYYPLQNIGPVITVHAGPGTLGLGYMKKRD